MSAIRRQHVTKNRVASLCLTAGMILGGAAAAETPADVLATAAILRDRALAEDHAYSFVRDLTVEVGSRLAGSPGDRAAVAWAEARLRQLGFPRVTLQPVTVPFWRRGPASAEILSPFPQPLAVVALGGSVPTPPAGITAEVLAVESLEALAQLDDSRVRGKIVFFDRGQMPRLQDGSGYGVWVQARSKGPAAAAAKGAVAVVIRSAGSSHNRLPHTGTTRYDDQAPAIPAAALSNPDADLLAAQLARGPVRLRLQLDTERTEGAQSANVIAEIPGRERPDEVVLLGAHLDSWDLGTGALDDGAGCAIVVAAARLLLELPERPRRTVRVVLFANEEFGLDGARAYAKEREPELAQHQAAAEADFGAGRVWRFRSAVAPEALPAVRQIASVLAPLGIEYQGNEARGGADLSPLAPFRVPFFDLTQDGTEYFDHHHTANDTLDKIDPEALRQNVAAYAVLAYLAAELSVTFSPAPERPAE